MSMELEKEMNCPDCGHEIAQDGEGYAVAEISHAPDVCIANLRADLAAERAAHAQTEGKLIDYKHLAEHANRKREQAGQQLAIATDKLRCDKSEIEFLSRERAAARAQVERLRGMLDSIMENREWIDQEYNGRMESYCPLCGKHQEDGHSKTCERILYQALTDAPPPAAKEPS